MCLLEINPTYRTLKIQLGRSRRISPESRNPASRTARRLPADPRAAVAVRLSADRHDATRAWYRPARSGGIIFGATVVNAHGSRWSSAVWERHDTQRGHLRCCCPSLRHDQGGSALLLFRVREFPSVGRGWARTGAFWQSG
jgi:hypothetical protein